MTGLPTDAEVVVVGGGVMGLSAAYHLARAGVTDVVVLDRGGLGEGSTCRAAGGVRALFSDETNIRLGLRSLEAFRRFGSEPGQQIDLHESGYLLLLSDDDSVRAFERDVRLQQSLGVPSRMVSVEEARRLSPSISPDGLLAAVWSPRDGHCAPESVVLGYASAARRLGVRTVTGCAVDDVEVVDGRVVAVATARGRIRTGTVVCTAGAWSREVGAMAGVDLPVEPLRRRIAVTDAVPDLDPATPFTIDFATSFYFHREGEGLLMGLPDRTDAWGYDTSQPAEWLDDLAGAIAHRAPGLGDVGVRTGWAGLYEMSPDHNAMVGRSRVVEGFVYATGFSGHGFLMGPAVGEVLRDLVLGTTPVIDVAGLSADRFAAGAARPERAVV